jgi:hypothetical protein
VGREKFKKDTKMTPVGIVLLILGLLASFKIALNAPGMIAAFIVIGIATVTRVQAVRTDRQLAALGKINRPDPWAKPSRKERNVLRKALGLSISQTNLTSLYPKHASLGYGLAEKLGYA